MSFLIFDNSDSNNLKECVRELYNCSFCDFKELEWNKIRDHYYIHINELKKIDGNRIDRKIDLLIINGPKSFEPDCQK